MHNFKPMLATNAKFEKMSFPIMSSKKLEGVRGEFTPNGLFTRPMKRFNNILLEKKFQKLSEYCIAKGVHIEGEFYKHGLPFSEISSRCRRGGHTGVAELEFHVFDIYVEEMDSMNFETRVGLYNTVIADLDIEDVIPTEQVMHYSKEAVVEFYEDALDNEYEGWVGKCPTSPYKKGRSTVNEGYFIRLKPEDTFDGVVLDIIEMEENLCESTTNELGYASKKQDKDMKAGKGLAAVAVVQCDQFPKPVRVSLSRGIKDYEDTKKSASRATIWDNKDDYIGKNIRFVGFIIKGMDLPRSPRFDDWRTDLD